VEFCNNGGFAGLFQRCVEKERSKRGHRGDDVKESKDSVTRRRLKECNHVRHATANGESSLLLSYSVLVMHRLLSVLVGVAVLAGTSAEAARSDPTDIGREDGLVTTLVVGGSAVPISDVPWQAALLVSLGNESASEDHRCGASIISDEWLVTAAHCVDDLARPGQLEVVVGKFRLSEMTSSDRRQVSNIVVSPKWDPETNTGDIALLRLSEKLVLNGVTVKAISLPTSSETAYWPAVGASYTVSGWGCTVPVGIDESASSKCWESYSDNFYSNTLRSVEVFDVSGPSGDVPCGDIGPIPNIAEQIICAGVASGGQDSCSGDSGGPLVALLNDEVTLAGVVSSGFGCAQAGYPGFYTRVSAFRSWIDEVTGGIPSPTTSGSFVALTPDRVMDSRSGSKVGELDGSGAVRELQVTGAGGVPSGGVSAVALNVTAVLTETNDFGGFVTVFPCDTPPDASNLNFTSGMTIPNSVIAPVSDDGKVCFYVYGKAHLLADVSGYFGT
jgi:secreted trypsin-like serine protease